MIVKKIDDGEKIEIKSFEKRTGMTAAFSGDELARLLAWCRAGEPDAFIERLFDLGIFLRRNVPETREEILRAVNESAFAPPELEALHIELTDACPLSCPQCYREHDSGAPPREMSVERFARIAREARHAKIFQIALGGGEPLAHPDILELVGVVGATEMSATLTTSGWGLTRTLLRALIDAGLNHMQVSLNGADRETHERSRDGYDCAMDALKMLSACGLSFGINWTARRDNLDGFEDVVRLAGNLGAENVNVLRYKPTPGEAFASVALNEGETRDLAETIRRGTGRVKIKVDSAYSQLLCYMHGARAAQSPCGCAAGRTFFSVAPDGTYKPCSHLDTIGVASSLSGFAASAELERFREIRDHPADLCETCRYKAHCGGCAAICRKAHGKDMKENARERRCIAYAEKI